VIDRAVQLLNKHGRTGVLFDTNLLFVYLVGAVDRGLIEKTKRTRAFTIAEFDLIVSMMDLTTKPIITAYVASEVSNLATALNDYDRDRVLRVFRAFITSPCVERHIPLGNVAEIDEFETLGTTDTAILRTRTRPPLVVTADWPLASKLHSLGRPVINFNHIRGASIGIYTP
jgi:hypothetical protein